MNESRRPAGVGYVPPKKPKDKHKKSVTVTLEPEHCVWLRENYKSLGFRSESHAVDEAVRLMMELKSRDVKKQAP
jgi:Arc/MetJ-type ribon-helix-helix transcriptional regulator